MYTGFPLAFIRSFTSNLETSQDVHMHKFLQNLRASSSYTLGDYTLFYLNNTRRLAHFNVNMFYKVYY